MRSAGGGARGGSAGFWGLASTPALPAPDAVLEADHQIRNGVDTDEEHLPGAN
jgi:hypothetical protein